MTIGEYVFADDLVMFTKNRSELNYNLTYWKEALKKRNMNVNMEETKIMILGGEESVGMEVEGIKLEQVKSFKYLGVQIQNNGKQEAEISERISTAMKIYYALNRNFKDESNCKKKTKVNVYKSIFCSILTYSCENWMLTKDIKSRIQAAEMKYLRRIKGIARRDRVRNEVMRQELKVEPILKKIRKHQLKWLGHLMRMNTSIPEMKM